MSHILRWVTIFENQLLCHISHLWLKHSIEDHYSGMNNQKLFKIFEYNKR